MTVPCAAAEAFAMFTLRVGSWWPREFTSSQDSLALFGLEPREGGACFEVGPYGFRCDWGRVLTWQPPRELKLKWQKYRAGMEKGWAYLLDRYAAFARADGC
jgi:hypothetical protein